MYLFGDYNVTMWRRESIHDRRECNRNSDNKANYVATGYQSNDDGFGIKWLRDPEKPI